MINKWILAIALGLFLYLGTQVAKADTIIIDTSANGRTTTIYNMDTGDSDTILTTGRGTPTILPTRRWPESIVLDLGPGVTP